jgi:ADP-heptose:LPS heptosyltransferase
VRCSNLVTGVRCVQRGHHEAVVTLADPAVKRVALVRLRVGLGDLLCSMPATRALRRFRPDLHVTLVTWPEMGPVVARMGDDVDELLPFPGFPGIPERPPRTELWTDFVDGACSRRFDLAVQCYGANAVANRVTSSLGARHIGGFLPVGCSPERDHELHLRYPAELHEKWRHLALMRHLGVPAPAGTDELWFPIHAKDEEAHQRLLAEEELVPGGYAVVHPGATSPSRRWPAERFAAVADWLAHEGVAVVLTGTPAEAAITSAVRGAMSHPAHDLTGATSLGGLAALLRDCATVVANDTGTAHLAVSVKAPTVTVFLSGDPVRWAHPGPENHVVRTDVGCNPCSHLMCPIDYRCAHRVDVEAVIGHVRRSLRQGARTSAWP